MSTIITAVLTKLATSLSSSAVKTVYGSLTRSPSFERAILNVQSDFPELVVEPSLNKWCENIAFNNILNSFKEGNRPPVEADIVSSYIEVGEFYAAENTESDAQKILIAFFSHLEREIYISTDGSAALAKRQEVLHGETRAEFQEAIAPVQNHLLDLKASVSHLQASMSDRSISPQELDEKIYHTRIDEAHRLSKRGQCKVAMTILQQLRKDTTNKNVSKSVLYRLATNLGYCNHVLNDIKGAQEEFELAYRLEPSNTQAISNVSAIKLEKGNAQGALDLIQNSGKIAKAEPALVANYIVALLTLKKEKEFDSLIHAENWILENPDCCFAIGIRRFEDGRYQEAEPFLRKADTLAKNAEPRFTVLLAHCLIRPTQQSLQDQPILRSQFPTSFHEKLTEANQLLTRAIDLLTPTDNSVVFVNASVLRADVRRMQGDIKGALEDCDLALSRNKDELPAKQLKAICCLHERKIDEAIQLLEPLQAQQSSLNLTFPLVIALAVAQKHEKICQILEPLLRDRIPSEEHIKLCDCLLAAYLALSKHAEVQNLLDRLRKQWPNNAETLVVLAHYLFSEGKMEEAENALVEALSYASQRGRPFIALELADVYYSKGDFPKAANLYGAITGIFPDEFSITQKYLGCLYNSGNYTKALTLARRIRNDGEPIQFVSQIEANRLLKNSF